MDLLNEARVQLESVVSEDVLKEYFKILRQRFFFQSPINIDEFDRQARKLLLTKEQVLAHKRFLQALLDKTSSDKLSTTLEPDSSKHKTRKLSETSETDIRNMFQPVDFKDYLRSSSPPIDLLHRLASNELFQPDHSFISTRIQLAAWENGLLGAESNVTDLILTYCQVFVKNILMAMITRLKGYKVRDGKFQYGFNQPIPDPFLRNYGNIIDDTAESRVDVLEGEDTFLPRWKPSFERMEQQNALAYSCAKRRKVDNVITVKLLYDTLRDNPKLLGSQVSQQLHLLRLNLND